MNGPLAGSLRLSDHIAILKLNRQRCAEYLLAAIVCLVDRSVYLLRNRALRISSGWSCRHPRGPKTLGLGAAEVPHKFGTELMDHLHRRFIP
jgi:hypothetical protein